MRLASLLVAVPILLAGQAAAAQGIAPPPPIDPTQPGAPTGTNQEQLQQQQTTQKLDEAEREDSKRNFELFWVDAHLGGSYINMAQLSDSDLRVEKASSLGPAFSLGAGLRFVVLTLGARARYNALAAFNMWQLNGEVGLKLPISTVDLLFGLHGGYSFVGSLGQAAVATNTNTPDASDSVKIRGFNAGLDVAVDYYVSPMFSVGVGGIADFLFLNRPPVDKPAGLTAEQQAAIDADPLYQKSGTSAGFQAGLFLRLGLHFGL